MSSFRFRRVTQTLALVVACASVSATVSPQAFAEPNKEELSKARARFQQATELEQAGNWASALQQFREVGQVRMTPQVRYHIALCEEKLGKLVAALGGFELALSEADSLGPDFRSEVEEKTNALRERIPKIILERGDGAEAATIELDGISLGASSVGVEVPLDPGPHQISARASGYEAYTDTIEVPEKETKHVVVTLTKIEESVPPTRGEKEGPAAPVAPQSHPIRTVAYVVGGVGAASLLSSGYFYLKRQSQINTLNDLCGGSGQCPANVDAGQVNDHRSKLNTYDALMKITLIGGPILIAGAVVLLVFEPKLQKPTTTGLHINPAAPGANVGGFSLAGAF